MRLGTLLNEAMITGFGLFVEAGGDDESRELYERLIHSDDPGRHEAFERAWQRAQAGVDGDICGTLLDHTPFQEAVVRGLLDPISGFDVQCAAEVLGDRFPAAVRPLKRLFTTLENALLDDDRWGPLLDCYQQLRLDESRQQALEARNLHLSVDEVVQRVSVNLTGAGAMAMQGGVAAGAGGIAVGGNVSQIVLRQIVMQRGTPVETASLRQRYLTRLRNHCWALPLVALGGDADPRKTVTLDQVYIALNTTTSVPQGMLERIQRGDIVDLMPGHDYLPPMAEWHEKLEPRMRSRLEGPDDRDESRLLPALDALRITPRLALLGDPGSGKSTFTRIVMAQLAGGSPPDWLSPELLPILVTLRDVAPRLAEIDFDALPGARHDEVLADTVRDQMLADLASLDAASFESGLMEALNTQQCLLVFDGLDEVAQDARAVVRRAVGAVLARYAPPRVIVTCRVRSYVGDAVFPDFTPFILASFDNDQIAAFAHAWYRSQSALGRMDTVQTTHKAEDLARAAVSADLHELSSNPMLLTTMALIHYQDVGLPKERVRLYTRAVDILLYRWQREKVSEDALAAFLADARQVRQVMERLAYEAHMGRADETSADVSRYQAQDLLEEALGDANRARTFLNYVDQRAGLLLGRGGDLSRPASYSFPHRTFQEYLAGCYLLTGNDSDRVQAFYACAGQGDGWNLVTQLGAEELLYNTRNGERQLLYLAYNLLGDDLRTEQTQRAALWSAQMATLAGRDRIARDHSSPNGGEGYLKRLLPSCVTLLASHLSAPERHQAGVALAHLGDPRFRPDAWYLPGESLLGFVEIPAGSFLMGSDPERDSDAFDDEQPQHDVHLPAYYIARYPVTVAQFRAFVEESGYEPSDEDCLDGLPNHPVVSVNWHDAVAYCNWLTTRLRSWTDTPLPLARLLREGAQVTLPGGAEWEKAARGTDGRRYPWGNEEDANRANYAQTGIRSTSTVGCFPGGVSPYGLQDMSGNVFEWTRSVWQEDGYPYPEDQAGRRQREDPQLPGSLARVLRGGSFVISPRNVRCAFRVGFRARDASDDFGFRVVVSVLP